MRRAMRSIVAVSWPRTRVRGIVHRTMNITIGILGFAHGHVGVYCDQWMKMPDRAVRIAAGWDHDAQRLAAAHDQFKFDACASPEALVRRDDVAAVVIGTETSMHAELVELAAEAG